MPNFKLLKNDEYTNDFLQKMEPNEISYGSYIHIDKQPGSLKMISIDGLDPEHPDYKYKRDLYYVYKVHEVSGERQPVKYKVKLFLDFLEWHKYRESRD